MQQKQQKKLDQQKKLKQKEANDRVHQMFLIHSMQVEAFAEALLSDKQVVIQLLRNRVNEVYKAVKLSNKFFESVIDDELEELSSQVSDSLLEMITLPQDKLEELTQYIDKFCQDVRAKNDEKA